MKKISKFIVIDIKSIFLILGILAALWVAFLLKTVLIAIFIATIIALGLDPAVQFLKRKKLSQGVAVAVVYSAFVITILGSITFAATPIVSQTQDLGKNFSTYLESLSNIPELKNFSIDLNQEITKQVSAISGQAVQKTLDAFAALVMGITVLVLTAYLLLDFEGVRKNILALVPKPHREQTAEIIASIEEKLGMWLRGQIALMLVIGTVTFVGLTILDVKFALSLAVIAGLLEVVPMIGPTISVIPALIVGFSDSSFKGLGVLGLYIIIQQLENNFVVPKVMQKAVGFNPLVTLIAILVGGNLMGVLGAILAIPIALIGQTIIKSVFNNLY
ncbi:AI-2E family transporter [bacterium]|nr:AI-2E family transporter [bacterium]